MRTAAYIALVTGMLVGGSCFGQSPARSLVECTHVANESARLQCYDEAMTRHGHKIAADTRAASTPAMAATTSVPSTPANAAIAAVPSMPGTAATAAIPSTPATVAVPAAPSSAVQAPTPSSKQSEFGMTPDDLRKKRAAESPHALESQELVARVRAVSERAHGELSIELENDQVWVETQVTRSSIAPAVGETITIRRGALGSYFLTRESGRALRVKRIQ